MADHQFTGTLSVTGNVGIGTEPLPNVSFYIRSSTPQSQVLVENSAGSLFKLAVDTSEVTLGTNTGTLLPFRFQTNGTSRLSIDSSGSVSLSGSLSIQDSLAVNGNVGIGTSTPGEKLDVVGTVKATAFQGNGSALTDVQVPDGSITTTKLANGAIANAKLAANSVDATKITDNAVTTAKLANNSVTNLKIADNSVNTAKIADNSIGPTKLSDNAVTTSKLVNEAVTLEKLALTVRPHTLNGVSNPNGDIRLVGANTITLTPNNTTKQITIGESHSGLQNNPHNVTATQVGALPLGGGNLSGSLNIPTSQLSFGSQTRQMINLWGSQYGIGVQSSTTYFRSNTNFCWFRGGNHHDERDNPGGGARLMALNEAGDLILSARTNPTGVSTGSRCRALVDLGNQLSINHGNDFSNGIVLNGTTTFGGSIGGFTGEDADEWPKIFWYRDINAKWDEGLIKHSSQRGFFNRSGFGIHIHESRDFGVWSTNWNPLFGIQGGTGNVRVRGTIQAPMFLGALQGPKIGYVVDQFINQVGEQLEVGDVVVLGHNQTSLFYGDKNDVPIPEVDMTATAYDTRVCGIVCQAYSNPNTDDEGVSGESTTFDTLGPEEQAQIDTNYVQPGELGLMVTLGTYAYCKVDADIAPIKIGDLLTTSPTKGHAQKLLDHTQALGAILGKALDTLEKGKGKISVLVTLQ